MKTKFLLFIHSILAVFVGFYISKVSLGVTMSEVRLPVGWLFMTFIFGNSLMVFLGKQIDFVQRFLLTTSMQMLAMLALFLILFKVNGLLPPNMAFSSLIMYMVGVVVQSIYLHRNFREK